MSFSKEKMIIRKENLGTKIWEPDILPSNLRDEKANIGKNLEFLCPHFLYLLFYAPHMQVLGDKIGNFNE